MWKRHHHATTHKRLLKKRLELPTLLGVPAVRTPNQPHTGQSDTTSIIQKGKTVDIQSLLRRQSKGVLKHVSPISAIARSFQISQLCLSRNIPKIVTFFSKRKQDQRLQEKKHLKMLFKSAQFNTFIELDVPSHSTICRARRDAHVACERYLHLWMLEIGRR